MSNQDPTVSNSSLLGRAAQSADHALDGLSSSMSGLQANADNLGKRGQDAWRQGVQQVREGAQRANDNTRQYIQDEPVKAMLIAAGAGAALMAVMTLLARSRRGG